MFTRKSLFSALIAAGALGAAAIPLPSSAASFDLFFNATPARHDYSYGSGYSYGRNYYYDHQRHYQPSRWDRDGDGIPNRRDSTPDGVGPRWDRDNDGIPNRRDPTPYGAVGMRDRDGDGVPNRFDNYPNNPRWR